MDTGVRGKVVLVTGASSGIGRATALAYGADGAKVAVTYCRNKDGAEETARLVEAAGGQAMAVRYDLTDPAVIAAAVQEVAAAWGGIDVLIANAIAWTDGIPRPGRPPARFEDVPYEVWNEVLRTTVDGVYRTIQAVLPHMRPREWGRIVLLSCGLAEYGIVGSGAYSAAKSALLGLARGLCWEVSADDVFVNVVLPGQTLTENVVRFAPPERLAAKAKTLESGRLSEPAHVAASVLFLGSAANGNITGQALRFTSS